MTQGAIRDGFEGLRRDHDMLPLADAARCRSEADWLMGINGTRAMTAFNSKEGGFYKTTVGRVQTPTLAILVEREERIRAFQPRDYWEVHATFAAAAGEYSGRWFDERFQKPADDGEARAERLWDRKRADAIREKCVGKPGVATEESKPASQLSPTLYDLTSLQRDANGRFGFSARTTLALAQALYEKHKALTYPRTDSRALPEDYLGTVKKTLDVFTTQKATGYAVHAARILKQGWVKPNKRIFDNKKISDHFAIIPTMQAPRHLSEAEGKLYDLVVKRFLAVFFPAAEYLVTTRITRVEGEAFKTEGRVMTEAGWLRVYGKEAETSESPSLVAIKNGEKVRTREIEVRATQTKPPARFTEATLLSAMEGAGKLVEDEELREAMSEKGLGTPATRAQIIEGLIFEDYVHRIGRDLHPTPKAFSLLFALRHFGVIELCSPELTGELGIQAEADGARQAAAQRVHGSHRRAHPRDGLAHQARRHSRHRFSDPQDPLPEVRQQGAGKLPQVQVQEVRLLDLEGRFEPRVRSRRDRDADREALGGTADRIPQPRWASLSPRSCGSPRSSARSSISAGRRTAKAPKKWISRA